MSEQERLFCSKPFEWFDISDFKGDKGDVYLCCPAWLSVPVGNIRKQSVDAIWNGAEAQRIRRSIHDGTFESCRRDRCPFLETVTGPVQRIADVVDPELRRAIDQRLEVLPNGPRSISCSYDKSCNLSCPTCRSTILIETDKKDQILEIEAKLRTEGLKDARLIYITGSGDPFASAAFFRLLTSLDVSFAPQLRSISLQSNGLLWNQNNWQRIPATVRRFINHAHISVDAAQADTYAINRRNGNFEKLLDNLEFIASLRREGPIEWLMLSMVVQENNFRQMPDFVRLGRRFHADSIQFHRLLNWGTFSDEEYRQRAVHLPGHPLHKEFLEVLGEDIIGDSDVLPGNFSSTREKVLAARGAGLVTIGGLP